MTRFWKSEHQTFDFIIVSGLLNEIEEPVDFLKSIKRLCKNGHTVIHVNVKHLSATRNSNRQRYFGLKV